jgi:hypothetical protein
MAGPFLVACAVLIVAGAAKLMSPIATRHALATLGLAVPTTAVRAIGVAEVATGGVAALVGGWIPVLVGAAYTAFAAITIGVRTRESGAGCGCFGGLSPEASRAHALIDAAFAFAAFASVGFDGLSKFATDDGWDDAASVAWTLAAVGLACLLLAGPRSTSAGGAWPGAASIPRPAHDLVGSTPDGDVIRIALTDPDRRTVLAFLSTNCITCRGLWETIPEARLGRGTDLVVVTRGSEAEPPDRIRELAGPGATVVMSSEAWTQYGIELSPTFVLVDGSAASCIAEASGDSWSEVSSLLKRRAPVRG